MFNENKKVIYLNIRAIQFPITAIASILHRISGFLLFLIIGPVLWMLKLSISSEEKFYIINSFLLKYSYISKFLVWIVITILNYHVIFGIRQILMDFGYLKSNLLIGKISAKIVFTLVIVLSIYLGIHIIYNVN